MNVQIINHSSW